MVGQFVGSTPTVGTMIQVTRSVLDLDKLKAQNMAAIPDECNYAVYVFDAAELQKCVRLNIGLLRVWSGKPVIILNTKELREFTNASD